MLWRIDNRYSIIGISDDRLQGNEADFVVYYRSVFDAVRELLQEEAFPGENTFMKKYLKPDLLIINDMGLKHLPRKSGEYLFEIIMRRYENRSTIMTSNRPIEEWGKLVGDLPSATAILDRYLHHAEVINIKGKSYRLKDRAYKKRKQCSIYRQNWLVLIRPSVAGFKPPGDSNQDR